MPDAGAGPAPLLTLAHLGKAYGGKVVFRDVSCEFVPASVSLVAGGNGAGKSTLLRLMAGLSRPTAGTVRRRDDDAPPGEPPLRLGYLGHATFLYGGLTALENLAFWRTAHGLDLADAALLELLERVGLAAQARERTRVFSRGMAQRLSLARVLMLEPELLLLDEPATGLDAASRELLHREVAAARARGACVVMVSHDLASDAPLADRLLALENGLLAYDGPAAACALTRGAAPCCA